MTICKLCEPNGDFADAGVRFGFPTHLRQHRHEQERHRKVLKRHEARGAGSKGGGSGGVSGEKDAGSTIAYTDGVKPFTSKMVRFIIDSSNSRCFRTCGRHGLARFALGLAAVMDSRVSRKAGRDIHKRITPRRDPRPSPLGIIFAPLLSW